MISVIGAGPSGSYYASLASKHYDVHLFEEHKSIGKPVACTGILTDNINQIMTVPKELVINKINRFKIIAPNNKHIYIDLKKPDIILDRARFDEYLFQKAVDNDAKIHLGEKFLGYKYNINHKTSSDRYMLKTDKSEYSTGMIVGSDGPNSMVAKNADLFNNRKFVLGLQVRAKYPNLEEGTTIINLSQGQFSWIVPEDDKIARIGVIGQNNSHLHNIYKKLIDNTTILDNQSGLIPVYNPKQHFRNGNVFIIGDAAAQVKATTYGGILYGLVAAKYLARDKDSYEKNFNQRAGKELKTSLTIREYLNHMTENQANELIDVFQKNRNKEILSTTSRDNPRALLSKLLLREPKLWKIGAGIFKNKLINKKSEV